MMTESRNEDVRSIGDAGDSSHDSSLELHETLDSPVCEMVRAIKRALQCGDHQGLKMMLQKLEAWKQEGDQDMTHDYWRVAQYIGETEMNNMYVLLSVTCDKPDNVKWTYLDDALSVLAFCLCNREIVFKLLAYSTNITPILVMALEQDSNDEVALQALKIINIAVTVCRARFARGMLGVRFLDKLVDRLSQRPPLSTLGLLTSILYVIKSLLMCGQSYIHNYAVEIMQKLSGVVSALSEEEYNTEERKCQEQVNFYYELLRSTENDEKPHICAKYWTKGRLRKDLLSECLKQPWLYVYCSWPACGNHNGVPNTFFRKCGACNVVRYCSRQCQVKHWEGGHGIQCKLISNLGKSL